MTLILVLFIYFFGTTSPDKQKLRPKHTKHTTIYITKVWVPNPFTFINIFISIRHAQILKFPSHELFVTFQRTSIVLPMEY